MRVPSLKKRSLVHSQHVNYGDSDKGIISSSLQVTPADTCLVWGALAFTLRLTRFFGTAPLSFVRVRSGCWKVRVSPLMCIYSCIIIVVLNLLVFSRLVLFKNTPAEAAILDEYGWMWVMDISLVVTISTYGIFSGPFRMKQFIVCLDHINKVLSTTLNREHIMRKPENLLCWIIILYLLGVISMFLANTALFFNAEMWRQTSVIQLFVYMCGYVVILILDLLELQFVLTAILPYTALKCINDDLNALTVDIEWKNSASNCKKVRRLNLAYSAICDVVRQVDESNGMLLLLFLVSFLMHMVITPFYVITLLFSRRLEFLMQVVWCAYHTVKMVMIVEPGRRMQQEIDTTQTLVGQLMNRASSPNDLIVDELDIFYKQILLNPVAFSPLGICILGRPLIASVIGAVTTYLVILVQFISFDTNNAPSTNSTNSTNSTK